MVTATKPIAVTEIDSPGPAAKEVYITVSMVYVILQSQRPQQPAGKKEVCYVPTANDIKKEQTAFEAW